MARQRAVPAPCRRALAHGGGCRRRPPPWWVGGSARGLLQPLRRAWRRRPRRLARRHVHPPARRAQDGARRRRRSACDHGSSPPARIRDRQQPRLDAVHCRRLGAPDRDENESPAGLAVLEAAAGGLSHRRAIDACVAGGAGRAAVSPLFPATFEPGATWDETRPTPSGFGWPSHGSEPLTTCRRWPRVVVGIDVAGCWSASPGVASLPVRQHGRNRAWLQSGRKLVPAPWPCVRRAAASRRGSPGRRRCRPGCERRPGGARGGGASGRRWSSGRRGSAGHRSARRVRPRRTHRR